ncbi:MAG: prepilin peptidase [Planctomycetota bacterium]|nr:MAG: prepilin peptidase [Planctomycetota bacterium]
MLDSLVASTNAHWPVWAVCWFVTVTLVVAAWIDGRQLKVPNWITFPLIVSGWVASGVMFGWSGLGWSLLGTAVGLGLLLPAYAIGGMGAGDVKLLAGVGAWVGMTHTLWAFAISAIVGAVLAVIMVLAKGKWRHHQNQFFGILMEIFYIRDPEKLAAIAAERKPRMMLLPYGIPIAIGTIAYFAFTGMLFPI